MGSFLTLVGTFLLVGLVMILYPGIFWMLTHIIESLVIMLLAGLAAMFGWQKFVAQKKKR